MRQLEYHQLGGCRRQQALGAHRPVSHGGEHALDGVGNRYDSRCQRSAAVFYIVAYGATIGTEAPGSTKCGQADTHDEPRARVSSWPPLRLARLR
jgi:hypothetical protein